VNVRAKLSVLLALIVSSSFVLAQTEDIDKDIQFHTKELDKLRNEIRDFEKRISETGSRAKSTAQKVAELDEEISLIRNLLYRLKIEEKRKVKAIHEVEKEIETKENEYTDLQDRYARRVVDVYRKGRLSDFEVLLDAESWSQAVYRAKYLKIINDYDKVLSVRIKTTLKEIQEKRTTLNSELKDMKRIDAEKSKRKDWLEKRRRMRGKELDRLKRDKRELAHALTERQDAATELEAILSRLDKERKSRLAELERRRREKAVLVTTDFSKLRGKLPWPVKGRITSRFGSHKNPTLKTVTENTGIDIRGTEGSEVKSVFDGIVTTVTYIRGYGNTIIIDHGGGYYTVYTHITDVEVEENSYVDALEVIAHVGDSGSLDGAKLHFEIWGNRKKLNPESWLKKS
jgi:septal ring factor EnvC (AmiA/AmiB activator)|tara:strand:+ start:639 stop:1841 length:1203 start_codon:yes stop_codon:yes gene_type:complete